MSKKYTKYTVFVSSTQRDLEAERTRVAQAILRHGHIPVAMEYFPSTPTDSWDLITQLIDSCDYMICLVAGRYGSVPAGSDLSFTEKEYDYAHERRKPVISFLRTALDDLPGKNLESTTQGKEKLEKFRAKIAGAKNVHFWTTETDLVEALSPSLIRMFETHPSPGWIRGEQFEELQRENATLKSENLALRARRSEVADGTLPGAITRPPKNLDQQKLLVEAYSSYEESPSSWLYNKGARAHIEWLEHHGYLTFGTDGTVYKLSVDGIDYMEHQESVMLDAARQEDATLSGLGEYPTFVAVAERLGWNLAYVTELAAVSINKGVVRRHPSGDGFSL